MATHQQVWPCTWYLCLVVVLLVVVVQVVALCLAIRHPRPRRTALAMLQAPTSPTRNSRNNSAARRTGTLIPLSRPTVEATLAASRCLVATTPLTLTEDQERPRLACRRSQVKEAGTLTPLLATTTRPRQATLCHTLGKSLGMTARPLDEQPTRRAACTCPRLSSTMQEEEAATAPPSTRLEEEGAVVVGHQSLCHGCLAPD